MRLTVFSDIHGNEAVLRKMLEKERHRSDSQMVFCGDICGYYYHAEECMRLLSSIPNLIMVRGNHDQYYLEAFEDVKKTEYLVSKYGSSYRVKTKRLCSFIEHIPLKQVIRCNGRIFHIQHGAPDNLLEGRLYPDTALPMVSESCVFLTGHTHYRMVRKAGNALWVNPGSLGQPRDGKGFSYCVIDTDNMEIEFCTIEMDISGLLTEVRANDPENKYLEEILYRKP